MEHETKEVQDANVRIRAGLDLIKKHITKELPDDDEWGTAESYEQNRDLHAAISVLVDEFRKLGRLQ